jgi:YHS domain-containing protein
VSRGSTLLVIDASAVARNIDDAAAKTLLEPVLQQTSDLTLARTKVTDATLSLIAKMPRLRRLNISATSVTDAGIALLASHPVLEELIVSSCPLTDHASESIARIPALKRVYVWKTGFTPSAVASLRSAHEGLVVDAGDTAPAVALEKDEPVKPVTAAANGTPASDPGKDADKIAAAKAEALRPVNTMCPVSGKPVDAGFAIVYKGRVVGFCCRICLGQFLDDPAKFEASIK